MKIIGNGGSWTAVYQQTVERAFADMKQHRALRRFPRRGLRHAQTHTGLIVLANNLLAYHRHTKNALIRYAEPRGSPSKTRRSNDIKAGHSLNRWAIFGKSLRDYEHTKDV
jgi:hypothetical protein